MRTTHVLLTGPAVSVAEVCCDASTTRWSQPEPVTSFSVVLVRCGLFRRRVDGVASVADPTAGYLQRPGSIQQVAHPCGRGDCCTVTPPRVLFDSLVDHPGDQPLFTSPAIDLAHRMLVAHARQGADWFELTERATALLAGCCWHWRPTAPARLGRAPPRAPGNWSTRSVSCWQRVLSWAWMTSHRQWECRHITSAAPSAASPG